MDKEQVEGKEALAKDFRLKAIQAYDKKNLYDAIKLLRDSIAQIETAESYALLAYYTHKFKTYDQRTFLKDLSYGIFSGDCDSWHIESLFNKAFSLEPNNQTANFGLCDYYIQTFRYSDAVKAINNALKIAPDNLDLHTNLGISLMETNRVEEAIREFLLVADSKRDEQSYIHVSAAFFQNKEYDNAIFFAKHALNINPESRKAKIIFDKSKRYKENPPIPIRSKITIFFKNPFSALYTILTLFLIVAFLDPPYGYYMLLRLATSAVCVYSAVKFKTEWLRWVFGVLAVLYNPILPVHLGDKEIWSIVNIATIAYMWIALRIERRNIKPSA